MIDDRIEEEQSVPNSPQLTSREVLCTGFTIFNLQLHQ